MRCPACKGLMTTEDILCPRCGMQVNAAPETPRQSPAPAGRYPRQPTVEQDDTERALRARLLAELARGSRTLSGRGRTRG
jgi:hypothetical protein